MSRFVMTLGLVSGLSVAWIAFQPLAANATSTTGTTLTPITTNVGVTANSQAVVNPAQLTSTQIVQVQNALNNSGFSVIDTGRWDPATASALQQFQSSRTFVSNGQLTNQTLAALGVTVDVGGTSSGLAAVNASGQVNPSGLSSAQISEIQQALRNRGFNVAVNGVWGPSTISAVQQFDVSQGRASSGTLTELTIADLGVTLGTTTGTGVLNTPVGTEAATGANLNTIAPAAGTTSAGTIPAGTITTPATFPPSANTFPPSANTTTTGTTNTGVMGNTTGGAMGTTP